MFGLFVGAHLSGFIFGPPCAAGHDGSGVPGGDGLGGFAEGGGAVAADVEDGVVANGGGTADDDNGEVGPPVMDGGDETAEVLRGPEVMGEDVGGGCVGVVFGVADAVPPPATTKAATATVTIPRPLRTA